MEMSAGAAPPDLPPAEVAGRRIDWTPRDVVLGLLAFAGAFLILPIIPAVILILAFEDESRGFYLGASILNAAIYVVILAIAAYFTFGKYGGGLARLGIDPPRWSTLWWGLATLGGAMAMNYVWAAVVYFIEPLQQGCADQVPTEIREDTLLIAASAVLAIGFAPITEETFFRGFVMPGLARWSNVAVAVVVSGLLFGGAHLLGNPLLWRTFPLFSAIGIVFALGYLKSGNLLSSVFAHTAFNTIGIISIIAVECEP